LQLAVPAAAAAAAAGTIHHIYPSTAFSDDAPPVDRQSIPVSKPLYLLCLLSHSSRLN